jgi:hypothetical protein
VRDGVSGILFPDPSVEGLIAAIGRFEAMEHTFSPAAIVQQAARFSASRFRAEMTALVDAKFAQFRETGPFLA